VLQALFSNPIAPIFCFSLLLLLPFELYFEFDRCCFQRRPQTEKQLVLAQIGNFFFFVFLSCWHFFGLLIYNKTRREKWGEKNFSISVLSMLSMRSVASTA
jgi:hypothetical protein